jgi:fermentation-respiration switch protein FrsA (DUF1100 family)
VSRQSTTVPETSQANLLKWPASRGGSQGLGRLRYSALCRVVLRLTQQMRAPIMAILVTLVLVAVALTVGVRWLEPRFAFFPVAGESETPAAFGVAFEHLSVETADGERLHGWSIPHPEPRARIVYFHGNGGNLSMWAPILAGIARRGYSVLAFDYRGYGRSTGRPGERGLYRDVDAIVDYAWHSRGTAQGATIYWGRSLGATMAAYAATRRPPQGLVLESGFPDARSLVRSSPPLAFLSLFSTYRFPTANFLQRVIAPVLVMHGDHDTVVPYQLGQRLFDGISGSKQFFTVRGADHNDFEPPDPRAYWNALADFVEGSKAK